MKPSPPMNNVPGRPPKGYRIEGLARPVSGYGDIDTATLIRLTLQSYDAPYNRLRAGRIKAFLKKHQAAHRPRLTCEIGCGGGYWTDYLSRMSAMVLSIDINPNMIEAARENLRAGGNPQSNIAYLCADVADIPKKDWFDFIFFKDVIEHLEEDAAFLNHLAGMLKPGGTIYIGTQNNFSLNYLVEGILLHRLRGDRDWMGWDLTHVRFYNYWRLKRMLRQAGLKAIAWHSYYHLPYMFLAKLHRRWAGIPDPGFLARYSDRGILGITGWDVGVLAAREGRGSGVERLGKPPQSAAER